MSVSYDVNLDMASCSEECILTDVCICYLCKCCSVCTSKCLCPSSTKDYNTKMEEILGLGDYSYRCCIILIDRHGVNSLLGEYQIPKRLTMTVTKIV